ncbi:hypothetical protein ACFWUZ_30050 [Streptomyces sp. NPDC058646]|uniref:hypothetical protein n=1 Tax=Streptomyces sp. NPDC058646 TaxID=3346574 RepID=UPI00364B9174
MYGPPGRAGLVEAYAPDNADATQLVRLLTGTASQPASQASDRAGKATYFAMEPGVRYNEAFASGAPAPNDLFNAFTKEARTKFGCRTP